MDVEAGRRLKIMDRDITRPWEEFVESLSLTERAMTTMFEKLEIHFEKLELQVSRIAMEKGSSIVIPRSLTQNCGYSKELSN